MPHVIDEAAQAKRRREARQSAVSATVSILFSAAAMLFIRFGFGIEGFWGGALTAIAVLELGMIIPVWILLRTRLKEIEGGEEDAASEY